MDKVVPIAKAVKRIKDGMTVMVGGFLANGSPETLIAATEAKLIIPEKVGRYFE